MVNLQSSIDALQKEYNRNYADLEELENSFNQIINFGKKKERIASEIRYQIEKQKLLVRNQMIKESIKSLKKKQGTISDSYPVSPNAENRIQEDLKGQYEKLDVLVTQRTFHRESRLRIHSKKGIGFIAVGIGIAAALMFEAVFASFVTSTTHLVVLSGMGISFIASGSIVGICSMISGRKSKKILQKIKDEFRQDDPSYKTTYEEQEINQMIDEVIQTCIELHEQKAVLENKQREEQYNQINRENPINEVVRQQTMDLVLEPQLPEMDVVHKKR